MTMKNALCLFLLSMCGCVQIPDGVTPVKGFAAQRYLGTWYELARLDHVFERGLTQVSATYSLNPDGSLRVVNRGFDPVQHRWKQAEGRAFFVSGTDVGQLKVSFFGPFYGGYNVVALDEREYSYALVCGNSRSYLWILAREPELPAAVMNALTEKAKTLGFDTAALIHVQQQKPAGGQPSGGVR